MNDKKDDMPRRGEVKVMEVIVSRNRSTIGEHYQRELTEVFLKDGTPLAKYDPFNGCQSVEDVIQEAIDNIKNLSNNANKDGSYPVVSGLIEKLQALINY